METWLRSAAPACSVSYCLVTVGHLLGLGFCFVFLAEFRRAVAAQQRYEDLKSMDAGALAYEGVPRAEISRRIFEEFYSSGR